ncbi:protein NKG7 isoform X2 [Callithrix jacchus]
MEPFRSLALLTGSLGLIFCLIALSTDFWFVAEGPTFSAHSGLWPNEHGDPVAGYIHVTQSFSILAALWALVSVSFLVLSCIPSLSAPGRGPLISTITAFAAGKDSEVHWGIGSQQIPAEGLNHLSCPCLQPSPCWWPWRCIPASGGISLETPRSRPSSPGPSTWAGSQLSSCSAQVP